MKIIKILFTQYIEVWSVLLIKCFTILIMIEFYFLFAMKHKISMTIKYMLSLQATFNGWITIMNSAIDSIGVSTHISHIPLLAHMCIASALLTSLTRIVHFFPKMNLL